MKVIGICGSPRKKGSTTLTALEAALGQVRQAGLQTEVIKLADYHFSGCTACGGCRSKLDCTLDDDFRREIFPRLKQPGLGGFLFASPVYFGGITSQLKAFFDRCVPFRRNGFRFGELVAGGLTIGGSRNGGQELALLDILKSCLIQGMLVVPDNPPTSHFGAALWNSGGEDEVGLKTAVNLGKKLAAVIAKLQPED